MAGGSNSISQSFKIVFFQKFALVFCFLENFYHIFLVTTSTTM